MCVEGFVSISSGEVLLSTNKTKKTWEGQGIEPGITRANKNTYHHNN
jgi:hypothetical protein